jgi:hypothetical protein
MITIYINFYCVGALTGTCLVVIYSVVSARALKPVNMEENVWEKYCLMYIT